MRRVVQGLLVVLVTAMGSTSALAQRTLVDNTTGGRSWNIVTGPNIYAQRFTVGGRVDYTLEAVELHVTNFEETEAIRVSIYDDGGNGRPGNQVYLLANPSPIADDALNRFAAPENATLTNGARYFVVVAATTGSFGIDATSGDHQSGIEGWLINNHRHQRIGGSGSWVTRANSVRIKVLGNGINSAATGMPGISGMGRVGYLLSATRGTIADDNGIPDALTYQWLRVEGENETDIPGATRRTYPVVSADQGKKVMVRVSFTDNDGYEESRTSDAYPVTGNISAPPSELVGGELLIDNTDKSSVDVHTLRSATSAQDFASHTGLIALAQGFQTGSNEAGYILSSIGLDLSSNETGPAYLELHRDSPTGPKVAVFGSSEISAAGVYEFIPTSSTRLMADTEYWAVLDQDTFTTLEVSWSVTDDTGTGNAAPGWSFPSPPEIRSLLAAYTSQSSGTRMLMHVKGISLKSAATGVPTIAGMALVGETLTADRTEIADENGLPDAESGYSYQWIRVSGASETEIGGATGSTYLLADTDGDKQVKVRVSFTDRRGSSETRTSSPYPADGVIQAPATGSPAISGTAAVRETLTATLGTIADGNGLPSGTFPAGYSLQWVRVDADGNSNALDIDGATRATYRLGNADQGKRVKLRVSFADARGNPETVISPAYPETGTIGAATFTTPTFSGTCDSEDADQIWCATVTVGNFYSGFEHRWRNGRYSETVDATSEHERGYRRNGCFALTGPDDPTAVQDRARSDMCYGTIDDDSFTTGGDSYRIEGVYYFPKDDVLRVAFTSEIDVEALAGTTFAIAGADYAPHGGGRTREIDWRARLGDDPAWEVGATFKVALTRLAQQQGTGARGEGPTVALRDPPEEHDGENPFKLLVEFSAAPSGLAPKRDAASVLEVEGGTVDGAKPATKDANAPWEVTIEPEGDADVTVRVPVRACDEPGAVCMGERPLAEEAEVTVPGPDTLAAACSAPRSRRRRHAGLDRTTRHREVARQRVSRLRRRRAGDARRHRLRHRRERVRHRPRDAARRKQRTAALQPEEQPQRRGEADADAACVRRDGPALRGRVGALGPEHLPLEQRRARLERERSEDPVLEPGQPFPHSAPPQWTARS